MTREIANCFCGVLDLLETGAGYDSHFGVEGNIVTIMPLTKPAQERMHVLSYTDGSNERDHWIYGYTEDNCAIAILQKTNLAGVNSLASKFVSPLIVKGSTSWIKDVKTFDAIEFCGGIVDKLHVPGLAIDVDVENYLVKYTNPDTYTSKYQMMLDGIPIQVLYTIKTPVGIQFAEVPDLRNDIHSVLRFEFESSQPLDVIKKYYSYAMSLFGFCAARLNVHAEIRLYKKQVRDPIFVKLVDGFADYGDEVVGFSNVISLTFLQEKITNLLQILSSEKKQPYLLFLPSRNRDANVVLYTEVNDLCVAFEREYYLQLEMIMEDKAKAAEDEAKAAEDEAKAAEDKIKAAKKLTEELIKYIDDAKDCPDDVKEKAKNILSAQLKAFSPSLNEKILYFYRKYRNELKSITEIEGHDKLGIAKFYNDEEFEKIIKKFIKIRNKGAHAGIQWNGGEEIVNHLKILVYCSVLDRARFSDIERLDMLSGLYGRYF
jgi:hypothetical protein